LSRKEIVEQLLYPGKRAAKSGRILVVFQNGRSEEFRLVEDSNDTLRVGDEQGKIRDIPKQEIEKCEPVSQMPSGLVDNLTPQQFTDLVEFLYSNRRKK
jgi:putative heme-binding domain-containing protein